MEDLPEKRDRKFTELGSQYDSEQINRLYERLLVTSEQLYRKIESESCSYEVIKSGYSAWMSNYEYYLERHNTHLARLGQGEQDDYLEQFESRNQILQSCMERMKKYLAVSLEAKAAQELENKSVKSASKSSSKRSLQSLASVLSTRRLREEEKKAELEAKLAAYNQRQRLELARAKLKLEEEKIDITTAIAVADAKSKIIQKFERLSIGTHEEGNVGERMDNAESHKGKLDPETASFHPQDNTRDPISAFFVPPDPPDGLDTGYGDFNQIFLSMPVQGHETPAQDVKKPSGAPDVKGQPPVPDDRKQSSSQEKVMQAVVQHLRKPLPDIKKFSGDPMEFRRFIRQFHTKISANTDCYDEKMSYLEQYTIGEANKVVSGYSHLFGERAYKAAMSALEERYGNLDIIATAFTKKALAWPFIKMGDGKALDEYALFLVECANAVESIGASSVLEFPDNIKRLVAKLPFSLHDRWRNMVLGVKAKGKRVTFAQLVTFVKSESKKINDPIYGSDALGQKNKTQDPTKNSRVRYDKARISTNTAEIIEAEPSFPVVKNCIYCDSAAHKLSDCTQILSLSLKDRTDYCRKNGLCFGCARKGHTSKDCKNRASCSVCKKRHPTILHDDSRVNKKAEASTPTVNKSISDPAGKTTLCASSPINSDKHTGAGETYSTMSIIPVRIKVKNKPQAIVTYAFFDTGCNVSFISDKIMHQLGLHGKKMDIVLNTIGSPHKMSTYVLNDIQVCDLNMNNCIDLPTVYSKKELPVTISQMPTEDEIRRWPHLSQIDIPKIDMDHLGLMIGGNVPDAYSPLDIATGPSGSPHATRTRLGWVVWNVTRDSSLKDEGCKHAVVNRAFLSEIRKEEDNSRLESLVRNAINLDFPERQTDDKLEYSREDKEFLNKVEKSITYENGRFTIDLPFREENAMFPNNLHQSIQRLQGLKRKLMKNERFKADYMDFMNKLLDKDHAELVPKDQLDRNDGKVWYLPHHGVYHHKKPGKLRVVFDCSVTYAGVSLNHELLHGPDLSNSLLGVLLRFREERIAVTGDIEAMFHQVKVPEKDRDCLRFLWWNDGEFNEDPKVYRMTVHLFGATSSPSCCNLAIKHVAKTFGSRCDPIAAATLSRDMYVDDCLKSVPSEEGAVTLVRELGQLCDKGGFHLTKWTSNSQRVMESIPEEERAKNVRMRNLEDEGLIERALGVYWFIQEDKLGFQINIKEQPHTRRGILSIVSSIYDPLGMASPFVLTAKSLLQELCRRGAGWDEPVSESEERKWKEWLCQAELLGNMQIPRCYKPVDLGCVTSTELHCFADASIKGYGMVAYLRFEDDLGHIHCSFLLGRSRVAPLKTITVPRLELTAAAMSVTLCKRIREELNLQMERIYFWTDSMTVLRYIANRNSRFLTFVANRLAIIHDATEEGQWRYIDSKENPADVASRGIDVSLLMQHSHWLCGPDVLWKPKEEWPEHSIDKTIPADDVERRKTVSTTQKYEPDNFMDNLISQYSDWNKLKRIIGWILLYIEKLKERARMKNTLSLSENKVDPKETCLSVIMMKEAEACIVRFVQARYFPEEYKLLKEEFQQKKSVKNSSKLYKLDVFMKDGIIRVGGRLDRSSLSYDMKHPMILPKESTVTRLIVEDIHRTVGHLGMNSILSVLRHQFWVISAKSVIKRIISKCVICKRHQGSKLEQKMADLPKERLETDVPPFSRTGIDFFGPFYVRRARSELKRYGVIFTCMISRAVHLEVAHSLDTDSCIQAIRRFIARRGVPEIIRTDNGTNFVGAERELREEIQRLNNSQISNFLLKKNIQWRFNPPASSHFGGVWERLIRSVRKVLYSVMHEQVIKMDDEGLHTLFCEVEAILNGRPLTEQSDSINDLEALTPNHLLLMHQGESCPPGLFQKDDCYVHRRWRQIQFLADLFWKRWVKEYLTLLQPRSKWNAVRKNLKVGDIVLIADNTPRNVWSLGRVTEVYADRLDVARVVKLKTATGILTRPIHKLCKLLDV